MSDLLRLSDATLARLAASVQRPVYDRRALQTGIVHLGIGAFHRAHQAVMTEAVLASGDLRWGIVAASLRSGETHAALAPQDGLYTVALRDGGEERLSVIGAIQRIIVAPDDPEALLAAMCLETVRIVSLTVTEKGYCHDPATGHLNAAHPDIIHDLANPARPRSAPGYLVEALARRRERGLKPFTVLCCDNLPANGRTVHRVISQLAALRDAELGRHIAADVACPSTMVDRIVPATIDEDRNGISANLGLEDAWPVLTEPFCQWVIEDDFPQGRPGWQLAGAELTRDVAPFEMMKLRMLNGAHSSLAYLGYLAGHETVVDAAFNPLLSRYLTGLWTEIMPTVAPPPGVDLSQYAAALLRRFQNPTIRHRLWQIAMDGSQKLPQRLLGTLQDRLVSGAPIDHLALGVAGWARYVSAEDETGRPIDVRDPHAASLKACMAGFRQEPENAIRRLLARDDIFGHLLPGNARFAGALTAAFVALVRHGTAQVISRLPVSV